MIKKMSLASLAAVFLLAGCETIAGAGQDVSNASRAVQRAIN